ncbi:unnamed protein product [Bemisia tabaci]|uniref:Uncharacterized protein n=1 Tax=Bemisia tabaci TaxID=7038 RepID=A0A9P0EVE6_BEMTA|nr:unnamed protein product [Bemisia tabaci]
MALFSTKHPKNDWNSKSCFDSQKAQSFFKGRRRYNKPPMKTSTHFLCFPLVTDTSVPQLAASLKYFRQIATKPSVSTSLKADDVPETINIDNISLNPDIDFPQPRQVPNPDLQILPAIAFRPAGSDSTSSNVYSATLAVIALHVL